MAGSLDGVTIKKEIEDEVENADTQDSGQGQSEGQSNQKLTKVWGEDETRSLIEFAKLYIPKCKDSSYTRKQLLEDIASELQLIGYDCTAENVRNKLKYLRARYKGFVDYNNKHVQKRTMLYSDELAELYSLDYFEDQDFHVLSNGSSDSKGGSAANKKGQKSTIPASHVDLRTVVTSSKKRSSSQVMQKSSKVVAKKGGSKSRCQPLFQCGLCMEKFQTSYDMHGHACNTSSARGNESVKKKATVPPSPSSNTVQWSSLVTIQFLENMLKYQQSHKNSNFRKGNIWVQMSALLKRKGHSIPPREVEKKWLELSTNFEKTLQYNKTHKEKKKCAFYKRLFQMHLLPGGFSAFVAEELPNPTTPVRMTVEVSPFSFSSSVSREDDPPMPTINGQEEEQKPPQSGGSNQDLIRWLDTTWTEYKELERKREAERVQRHNEVMEMLAFLIECNGGNKMR